MSTVLYVAAKWRNKNNIYLAKQLNNKHVPHSYIKFVLKYFIKI